MAKGTTSSLPLPRIAPRSATALLHRAGGGRHFSAPGRSCAWANFPCAGNSDKGAHYKKSSKGVGGMANWAGAGGDKGNNQKGAGASGAGMSPPCTFWSSYEDNVMWSHVPVNNGNFQGRISQHGNEEDGCNTAATLLWAHIRGGRRETVVTRPGIRRSLILSTESGQGCWILLSSPVLLHIIFLAMRRHMYHSLVKQIPKPRRTPTLRST
jgi:hypothetical protein